MMEQQPTTPTKRCPACAEDIRLEATLCRFCGFNYLQSAMPQPTSAPRPAATGSTNGMAIASLVLGLVWIWGIGSILALVFGMRAKREIADSAGAQQGTGLATAGIVLGWVGVGILIFMLLAWTFAVGVYY